MKNTDSAICVICGKPYRPCLSCKKLKEIRPWRSITDTACCYKNFLTVSEFNNQNITKEEAKQRLESLSFDQDNLRESVRNKVAEIMS